MGSAGGSHHKKNGLNIPSDEKDDNSNEPKTRQRGMLNRLYEQAPDSTVDWDNWPEERKKAADLFMRITDDKLKDKLMEKANNNVEKFTVKFIIEKYQKLHVYIY